MMYCTGLSLTGLPVCRPPQTGAITQLVLSGSTVAENGTGGELVGTLSISGPDFTGPVSYSITSDPSLSFEVAGAGLDELRVKAAVSFNFEGTSSYPVDLQGVDSTAGTPKTFTRSATINVTNVNEAPTNIDLSGTIVIDNAADGTVIGVLSNPLDPDAGDTFTWSIAPSGDPSGNFEVVGTDFRVAVGNTLDNAVNASHSVTLRVTDAGGLVFDKAFTISVTTGSFSASFNFRSTSTFVTDGAGETYVLGDVYPTVRDGLTFGWASSLSKIDRSTSVARLAGGNFIASGTREFRVDLDFAGNYVIEAAFGDDGAQHTDFDLIDNTTVFKSVTGTAGATAAKEYLDANGIIRTSRTDWVNNNTSISRTFGSTIFKVKIIDDGSANAILSHLKITSV